MGLRQSKEVRRSEPSKIETRMVQAMAERAQSSRYGMKAFNSIIMKFPKIDESFEAVRAVFKNFVSPWQRPEYQDWMINLVQLYLSSNASTVTDARNTHKSLCAVLFCSHIDKDGNGSIDMEELEHCFKELQVDCSREEVRAFHEESDMDSSHAIEFKEFIVVLALIYLLGTPSSTSEHQNTRSRIGLPQLEATFDTIVEAFVFFDRNKDGYVSKDELVYVINEASPGRQGEKIGMQRFEEMDWDKTGKVTFKEFLFVFTDWVGLEEEG